MRDDNPKIFILASSREENGLIDVYLLKQQQQYANEQKVRRRTQNAERQKVMK